jgi:hypothetical protein
MGLRRREALLAAAALPLVAAAPARGQALTLAAALRRALELEQATLAVYDAAAQRGLLPSLAQPFAAHEREQIAALTRTLEAFGGSAPAEQRPADAAGTEGELAGRAIAAELAALRAHDAVLRATDEASVIATVAAVMAAAGTHLAVLRERLGREPVPAALERTATL